MAASDVTVSIAATPASTSGSNPGTFSRNADAKREVNSERTMPARTPDAISASPCRKTIPRMRPRVAPIASTRRHVSEAVSRRYLSGVLTERA